MNDYLSYIIRHMWKVDHSIPKMQKTDSVSITEENGCLHAYYWESDGEGGPATPHSISLNSAWTKQLKIFAGKEGTSLRGLLYEHGKNTSCLSVILFYVILFIGFIIVYNLSNYAFAIKNALSGTQLFFIRAALILIAVIIFHLRTARRSQRNRYFHDAFDINSTDEEAIHQFLQKMSSFDTLPLNKVINKTLIISLSCIAFSLFTLSFFYKSPTENTVSKVEHTLHIPANPSIADIETALEAMSSYEEKVQLLKMKLSCFSSPDSVIKYLILAKEHGIQAHTLAPDGIPIDIFLNSYINELSAPSSELGSLTTILPVKRIEQEPTVNIYRTEEPPLRIDLSPALKNYTVTLDTVLYDALPDSAKPASWAEVDLLLIYEEHYTFHKMHPITTYYYQNAEQKTLFEEYISTYSVVQSIGMYEKSTRKYIREFYTQTIAPDLQHYKFSTFYIMNDRRLTGSQTYAAIAHVTDSYESDCKEKCIRMLDQAGWEYPYDK